MVGTLQVFTPPASAGLVRATDEVARWVSGQLELAELDASRTRLMEAEVRALRAQISPHFIYNSLTAIASFVRTDPDRARELLLEFADFTRYSFRRHGEFTTLAEELRSIERYLRARAGPLRRPARRDAADRPRGAAGRVPVPLPAAARRERRTPRPGGPSTAAARITIVAQDADRECVITIEDDGVGEDPERVRRALARRRGDGLGRAGQRRRAAAHGLRRRLRPGRGDRTGAGTKVTVRVPKFAAGVHA